ENVELSLELQMENKGSVVSGGELNVCLDGLVVDLGSLPNHGAETDMDMRRKIYPECLTVLYNVVLEHNDDKDNPPAEESGRDLNTPPSPSLRPDAPPIDTSGSPPSVDSAPPPQEQNSQPSIEDLPAGET
ncbi:NEDD4-like E3 ubiquitin-protein ligase WWP2 isoform X4, partial [Silurus asotus]